MTYTYKIWIHVSVNANMEYTFSKELAKEINEDVINGLEKLELKMPIMYVTTSLYER